MQEEVAACERRLEAMRPLLAMVDRREAIKGESDDTHTHTHTHTFAHTFAHTHTHTHTHTSL